MRRTGLRSSWRQGRKGEAESDAILCSLETRLARAPVVERRARLRVMTTGECVPDEGSGGRRRVEGGGGELVCCLP